MAKTKSANQPRSFKVMATIVGLYALATARKLVSGNGTVRNITHRLLLAPSKSIAAALAECVKYQTAQDKPVAFCLERNDGLYALDLDQNQIGMLTRSGYRMDQLTKVAKGQTFSCTVELRLEGDEVLNIRTQEMIPIESNHAVVQAPSIALDDRTAQSLRIEDSVAAMVAAQFGIGAPAATQAAPANAPSNAEGADEPTFPEEMGQGANVARTRDTRRATAGNVKVK